MVDGGLTLEEDSENNSNGECGREKLRDREESTGGLE